MNICCWKKSCKYLKFMFFTHLIFCSYPQSNLKISLVILTSCSAYKKPPSLVYLLWCVKPLRAGHVLHRHRVNWPTSSRWIVPPGCLMEEGQVERKTTTLSQLIHITQMELREKTPLLLLFILSVGRQAVATHSPLVCNRSYEVKPRGINTQRNQVQGQVSPRSADVSFLISQSFFRCCCCCCCCGVTGRSSTFRCQVSLKFPERLQTFRWLHNFVTRMPLCVYGEWLLLNGVVMEAELPAFWCCCLHEKRGKCQPTVRKLDIY